MFEWLLGFDWFNVFWLAFGVSFGQSGGYSHSRSDTQATGPLSGQTREAGQALLNRSMYASEGPIYHPGVFRFQQILPTALDRSGLYEGQQPLNSMGLYEGQRQAFEQAVQQAGSRFSMDLGNRGFNTPRAIAAIAGSAAQNVASQFAPLIGQQIAGQNMLAGGQIFGQDQLRRQLNLEAAMVPETVRQQRNQQQLQFMQALAQALGNQSTGYERGWGINAAFQHSVGGGGGGGQALGAIMG